MSDPIHDLCIVMLLVAVWLGVPLWSIAGDFRVLRDLAQRGRG